MTLEATPSLTLTLRGGGDQSAAPLAGGGDQSASVAVYVHVPWCASLCPYCDFDKQATDFRLVDAYVDAVIEHIAMTPPRPAHSLYFGGGTPSLLTPQRLARLIDAVGDHFGLAGAEVTIEANPSDVVVHKMEAYLQAGANRVSLGVQSLDDAELKFLGRRHTADKARRAVQAIRNAGCTDLSLDLMYGLKGQSLDGVRSSLAGLIALEPDHLSCYALTLETTTPMGADLAAGRLHLPDDDAVADQYELIQETLAGAGFDQYETSNWARPGHRSTHNLTYWRNGEWIGLGAGAAGSCAGVRYKRTPDLRAYIAAAHAGLDGFVESEDWTTPNLMRDTVMLGLRLAEGLSDREFAGRFGQTLGAYCTDRLDHLLHAGVLRWQDDRLSLAPSSYFICNAVLAEILAPV